MSAKDCGHHDEERRKLLRRILIAIAGLIILIAIVIFFIWAILHPTKPRFILQDVTIYNFSTAAGPPYTLTSYIQVTISSRNPNDHIGIYHRKLDVYATYRTQQITEATLLPGTYQGHKDTVVWSPFLVGSFVPISPYLQQGLSQDLNFGSILINVKIDGRIKWKVGSWISGTYHLYVNCPAFVRLGEPGAAAGGTVAVGPVMKFQLFQRCHVETALGS
ncbi:hypothetical protein UlMin_017636 [Ulmus minor]